MRKHFRSIALCLVVLLAALTTGAFVYSGGITDHPRFAIDNGNSASVTNADATKGKLLPTLPQPAYKIVYLESDQVNSVIWSASPDSPWTNRQSVIALSHAHGYPPQASLSPNGQFLTYLMLDEGNSPAFNGTLWIVDLTDSNKYPRQIDRGVDYGWVPKWSPDGTSFIYVKKIPQASRERYNNEIHVGNIHGTTQLLSSDQTSLEVVPIGWSPTGDRVYVDRIEATGDTLYEIDKSSGREKSVARVSDSAAWNLALSPDGKQVLGSIQTQRDKASYSLVAISTETGERQTLLTGASRQFTAIWDVGNGKVTTTVPNTSSEQPKGLAEISSKRSTKQVEASAMLNLQAEWTADSRIPVSWSPDGRWLVLESHRGSFVELAIARSSDGSVSQTSTGYWTNFVGWTSVR